MKSLVAEDDLTSRTLLKKFLSRHGQCDVVADGKEAVAAFAAAIELHNNYDLICMDLKMPVMDGQEAIRQIRKQEADAGGASAAKIIVTTAHTDSESISGALLGRCNAYLVKPIEIAKLQKELKTFHLIR